MLAGWPFLLHDKSMATFSTKSLERLLTCHPDLQRLFREVVQHVDCSIICGYRSKEDQLLAFHTGKSQMTWPHSKHNQQPSLAVDVVPSPVDWDDLDRFRAFAVVVKEQAAQLGIEVQWGGDWQTFKDLPHWQLKGL